MTQTLANTIVVDVALFRSLDTLLTYSVDSKEIEMLNSIAVGQRVLVPIGKKLACAVVISVRPPSKQDGQWQLKPVASILDASPSVNKQQLRIAEFVRDYYKQPLGLILRSMLPKVLRSERVTSAEELADQRASKHTTVTVAENELLLTAEQELAVSECQTAIDSARYQAIVIDGKTNSGKTEVYLRAMKSVLECKKQILYLVPEIALIRQTVNRIKQRYPDSVVEQVHSGQSAIGINKWRNIRNGSCQIIVGTRSAVLGGFSNIGLVIVDEEHDPAYIQDDRTPCYHGRNLALLLAQEYQATAILGSATISTETHFLVQQDKALRCELTKEVLAGAGCEWHIVDRSQDDQPHDLPSEESVSEMHRILASKQQILLYRNLRGLARGVLCRSCGWRQLCPSCDTDLTMHTHSKAVTCHLCGRTHPLASQCHLCHQPLSLGATGTVGLETWCEEQFPDVPIFRIDSDVSETEMQKAFTQLNTVDKAIVIGTKLLAKGHHLPKLASAIVIDADQGLHSPFTRDLEHWCQNLMQVAGRAGRESQTGKIIVETCSADHPILTYLQTGKYALARDQILSIRGQWQLPPVTFMAVIQIQTPTQASIQKISTPLLQIVSQHNNVHCTGVVPDHPERINNRHRHYLALRTSDRSALHHLLDSLNHAVQAKNFKDILSRTRSGIRLLVDPNSYY